MSSFDSAEDEIRDLLPRFRLVYGVLFAALIVLSMRLWYLQIIEGDELRIYSEKNRVKETKIRAPRGLILDRESRILVDNTTGLDATISPQYATTLDETASALGALLDMQPEKIIRSVRTSRVKNGPFMPVTIKENLSIEEAYRIKRIRIDHPGLNVDETVLRHYPLNENGAQLFGYVGEISKSQLAEYNKKNLGKFFLQQGDFIGRTGLEEIWDGEIRGRDGLSFIEVDAHGRESPSDNKAFLELKPQRPIPGNNIILTLDSDIQAAAYKAMLEQADKIGPRMGALIAMKTNGEILAWVSTPSFNPNRFARGISSDIWKNLINDPFNPLRNKVVQDHYAPGSTLKPIVALSALQEGTIKATTIVSAPGQMKFGKRIYHDSLRGGHGDINVIRAIESSSNIFFYKMGIQLGIDNIAKYARVLGLGLSTNINVGYEAKGNFPTKEWKLKMRKGEAWQPGENLSNAIGQGYVETNLLQMTLAYNAIANKGKFYSPILVKSVIGEDGQTLLSNEPKILRDITAPNSDGVFVEPRHIDTVREGMRRVANGDHGTARWWKIPGIEMAGKTGTSQIMSYSAEEIYKKCENRPIMQRHHGSYIAFAPFKDPEVIVGILTEHACHGNVGGAPIVRDVILAYMQKYHPDLIKTKDKIKPDAQNAVPSEEGIEERPDEGLEE